LSPRAGGVGGQMMDAVSSKLKDKLTNFIKEYEPKIGKLEDDHKTWAQKIIDVEKKVRIMFANKEK
jgi:hypothetical protein